MKDTYNEILTGDYNRSKWTVLLNDIFGIKFQKRENPQNLPVDGKTAKNAVQLGEITLADGNTLAVYEVELQDNILVSQNRVTIRNLLRSQWNRYDGAFIASHKSNDCDWRFTFVSETRQWNADGTKYEKAATDAKRYTYILGKNRTARTANDRFTQLKQKATTANLDNVKETFSVEALTKEFYRELFDWYQWALSDETGVTYPNDTSTEADDRIIQEHLIRLITRIMFVWFIKQKRLIPNDIFDIEKLREVLKNFDPTSDEQGNYYNAVLQNLFFATLNRPINERGFAANSFAGHQAGKEHYGIKTLYRDDNKDSWFVKSQEDIVNLFRKVPFLNGGLFECLDKEKDSNGKIFYYDGFSRESGRQRRAFIPNCLFFDSVKGLISILKRYNFTIEENTPNDMDVALDPELLGKVFENLLGAYNPETKETARKQSGSFYTPREIVNYMVDESLKSYIQTTTGYRLNIENGELAVDETMTDEIKRNIYNALLHIKILDPACGSGAFPMGILNRIVDILKKLDTNINLYRTKLDLIEKCIFGVDIQTIAIQISKLRFFISLIVEQTPTDNPNTNYGILPLPNLESKFIAANTLTSLDKSKKDQLDLHDERLQKMKTELWEIRLHRNVRASSWQEKGRLRKEDENLCRQIEKFLIENTKPDEKRIAEFRKFIEKYEAEILELKEEWVDDYETQMSLFGNETQQNLFQKDLNKSKRDRLTESVKLLKMEIQKEERKAEMTGLEAEIKKMTGWNPYNQNATSPFFDPEWMFGLTQGFDIVIGNPPYISTKGVSKEEKQLLEKEYNFADDTYSHFFFKGCGLLNDKGVLTFISPKTFWTTQTKRNLRNLLLSKSIEYIFDTADPFEAAMVDTCITSIQNIEPKNSNIRFLDGSKDLKNPQHYLIAQSVYLNTQNSVIFKPTVENIKTYELYGQKVKDLYDKWWDKISTSKNIEKNKKELEAYRNSLKPGDIALLGCLTEGGQGLATANNGKYIAVRKSTKWAKNILESRPKKLAEAVKKHKIQIPELENCSSPADFVASLSERQIAVLFDDLKERYGRDIFGQGYIYRLINDSEIADVDSLTDDEKRNGISENKPYYVPYDKGDKDGNRWYLETPYAIAWTQKNVGFLKANSGKKGEGMPVIRNPQYYFKEGFCWTDVNSTYLKARVKKSGVFDVLSMSLFTQIYIPDCFFVCMINSRLISFYVDNFINNTSHFQINDARQLPIIIPSEDQLSAFEKLFNSALETKQNQVSSQISVNEAEYNLTKIQYILDKMVEELYGI
jgi:tRNA1(Val) A37 N6-methylase TrmN6